jgi:hypothetical protein
VPLVYVHGCTVVRGLVTRPGRRRRHIFVTHESTVAVQDVSVSAHAVTPVGGVLDVLSAAQLLRNVHFFLAKIKSH